VNCSTNFDGRDAIGNGEVDGSIPSGSTIFQNLPTALAAFFCVNDLAFRPLAAERSRRRIKASFRFD
jgi:hypothetical protein